MKLGILQCDSVLPEYQTQFGNYPEMFVELFHRIDPDLEILIFDVEHDIYPENVSQCDAYVTTGSKASSYDNLPWFEKFSEFLKIIQNNHIKLVTVCFGHQFLADILGGKTEKSDKGWGIGVSKNKVEKHLPWMIPPKDYINIVVSHQDQVIKLPNNAELIASSDFCPNFMYQLDETLSIQGHPEFSKGYSETMMRHRKEKIGESTFNKGLESLNKPVDDLIIAQWILNFCFRNQT